MVPDPHYLPAPHPPAASRGCSWMRKRRLPAAQGACRQSPLALSWFRICLLSRPQLLTGELGWLHSPVDSQHRVQRPAWNGYTVITVEGRQRERREGTLPSLHPDTSRPPEPTGLWASCWSLLLPESSQSAQVSRMASPSGLNSLICQQLPGLPDGMVMRREKTRKYV